MLASLSLSWVTARAAGFTAFGLLTASVALGLVLSSPLRSERWPRFVTTELHRFVTLLTLLFVALHVLVVLLDSFIGFGVVEVLVPFTSHYRPLWMGLGIVSAYLAAALWATSWLQRRIGYRWWRRLHYGTFAVWAGAAVHGLGSGSDTTRAWSGAIYLISFALVGGLLAVRIPAGRRAGQSAAARARRSSPAGASAPRLDAAGTAGAASLAAPGFAARIRGRFWQGADGLGGSLVVLEGVLDGGFEGHFQLRVHGRTPPGGARLEVTDNRLWLRGRDGALWWGRIDRFDGMRLRGAVTGDQPGAGTLAVAIELLEFAGESVRGRMRAAAAGPTASPLAS